MVNAGRLADAWPSLTLITMLAWLPVLVGVPARRPVLVLNVAQVGRFAMLKVSVLPSASVAVGVNAYCAPTVAVDGGVPLIDGGVFVGTGVEPRPAMLTFEKAAVANAPSL
jgi:hypothetical protein